jgi:hypothetical protein
MPKKATSAKTSAKGVLLVRTVTLHGGVGDGPAGGDSHASGAANGAISL